MTVRAALLTGALVTGVLGCDPDPLTEIIVVVRSDMSVPDEFDGFRIEVEDQDEQLAHLQEFSLANGEYQLPADFGVIPQGGDASRRITVEIFAQKAGASLFSTRAQTSFSSGEIAYLDMFLAKSCIGVTCPPSQTCRREGCADVEVEASATRPTSGVFH